MLGLLIASNVTLGVYIFPKFPALQQQLHVHVLCNLISNGTHMAGSMASLKLGLAVQLQLNM
jgi:hypothetical protein